MDDELKQPGISKREWLLVAAMVGVLVVTAMVERGMGRLWVSKSGAIWLWVNQTNGAETSQQVFDWYSITHMTHGLGFYLLVWLMGRGKWSGRRSFFFALIAESAWEVFENCPFTISRFRAATAADGYNGDTVLNSMFDIVSCMAGWAIARWSPVWVSVGFVVLTEVGLALAVRDNLTLNIIMLVHPFEGIKGWQQGGGN